MAEENGAPEEGITPEKWRDSLPEDLKASKSLEKFKSPADLAKSYVSLEQTFHESGKAGAIIPPKDGAPEGELQAFRDKLRKLNGVPENADGYDLKLPGDVPEALGFNDEAVKVYREKAHKLGLTPTQANDLFTDMLAGQTALLDRVSLEKRNRISEAEAALKEEWGSTYDYRKEVAQRLVANFADEKDRNNLEKFGNDPAFVRMVYNMGKEFQEDSLLNSGLPGKKGQSAEEMRSEGMKLMNSEAFRNPAHPDHATTVAKVNDIYKRATPA